jgi:hypothetical protein
MDVISLLRAYSSDPYSRQMWDLVGSCGGCTFAVGGNKDIALRRQDKSLLLTKDKSNC